MLEYLLLYGGFSFGSTLLGAFSAIILWVYCALQSARRLHDSVRRYGIFEMSAHLVADVACLDARTSQFL